jgi:hypothetical protein
MSICRLDGRRIIVTGGASGMGASFLTGQLIAIDGGAIMPR